MSPELAGEVSALRVVSGVSKAEIIRRGITLQCKLMREQEIALARITHENLTK